jgi:exopolysaccharide biosynthesis WecB/TagA/CpsF family protein
MNRVKPSVRLLGLDFDNVGPGEAAARVAARPEGAPFGYVVTPNADHLVRLARSADLQALYQGALLRLLDSRVVSGFCRLLQLPTPRVTTGSDLTAMLLSRHLKAGERVTIVGLHPSHLDGLARACGRLNLAHYYPPMGFDKHPEMLREAVDFVLTHPARFVFLAVGSPRQERLAAAIQATGRATGSALCVGASLDFLAGASPRAPAWMQHVGLEWLYRMTADPRRLTRRYLLDNPPIFALLLRERLRRRDRTLTSPYPDPANDPSIG